MVNSPGSVKIDFKWSRVGGNIDQNEPLRLRPMSFGLKLMDRGHLKVTVKVSSSDYAPQEWTPM